MLKLKLEANTGQLLFFRNNNVERSLNKIFFTHGNYLYLCLNGYYLDVYKKSKNIDNSANRYLLKGFYYSDHYESNSFFSMLANYYQKTAKEIL